MIHEIPFINSTAIRHPLAVYEGDKRMADFEANTLPHLKKCARRDLFSVLYSEPIKGPVVHEFFEYSLSQDDGHCFLEKYDVICLLIAVTDPAEFNHQNVLYCPNIAEPSLAEAVISHIKRFTIRRLTAVYPLLKDHLSTQDYWIY